MNDGHELERFFNVKRSCRERGHGSLEGISAQPHSHKTGSIEGNWCNKPAEGGGQAGGGIGSVSKHTNDGAIKRKEILREEIFL